MLFRDVRYALRTMLRTPGFAAVAVLSLALGIGVNSAIFSFADALLLRPLPVPSPTRVVTISDMAPDMPTGSFSVSYRDYVDLRDKSRSFDGMVAFTYTLVGMAEQREALPQLRLALTVSGNFFQALGVEPALGRSFSPEEDRVPGRNAVAILSHLAWKERFSADPNIVGRKVQLNDVEFTIIGVAPEGFIGVEPLVHPDLFIPVMMLPQVAAFGDSNSNQLERRDSRIFTVKARLKSGTSLAQANAEMTAIARSLAQAYPDTNRNRSLIVRTEMQARVAQAPPNAALASMLLGISGLVLIIACANVANLLLSRARSRSREMAVRLAIGAGRGRLLRQLLTESLILSLAGGLFGLLLAEYGVSYFSSIRLSDDLPVSLVVQLDHRVLIFSLLAAVLSALVFGLAPAIRSSNTDLVPALKTGESTGRRGRTLGRNALVIAQVALSLMLLCAATMFIRTFRLVLLGSPGFRTDHLLMMSFDPTLVHYSSGRTDDFFRTLVERARQLPGAQNAALSHMVPFEQTTVGSDKIVPEGTEFPPGKDGDTVLYNTVDDRYFETMGVPLLRGRVFRVTDTATSPRVAVINQAMSDRYWPNRDPIGQRLRLGGRSGPWLQVVGVAQTGAYTFMGEPRTPLFYVPLAQDPQPRMTLMVETAGDAAALTEPLRDLVRSIDAHQPIYNVRTMQDYYQVRGLQFLRLIVNLVGAMGILGLTMALVGLYGLVTYTVSRRTREIGIRMAIGAAHRDILRMVLRQGLTLTLIGLGLGLAGSFGLVRAIRALFSRLQDTGMFDPWTFIAVPLALFAVTMLASYIPARRAAAIDPNQALHYE